MYMYNISTVFLIMAQVSNWIIRGMVFSENIKIRNGYTKP